MATKSDFTPEQWEALAYAVTDTLMFVSASNGLRFWEGMSESSHAARYLVDQSKSSPSTLVRDLALDAGRHRDKTASNPVNMENVTLDRVTAALATVNQVAPEEAEAFKGLLTGVAQATAEAKNGVDEAETSAIEKIKSALA